MIITVLINPEAAEKYKFLYNKVYKDIYPSLKKVNKNLFEYQAKYVQNMKKQSSFAGFLIFYRIYKLGK